MYMTSFIMMVHNCETESAAAKAYRDKLITELYFGLY